MSLLGLHARPRAHHWLPCGTCLRRLARPPAPRLGSFIVVTGQEGRGRPSRRCPCGCGLLAGFAHAALLSELLPPRSLCRTVTHPQIVDLAFPEPA